MRQQLSKDTRARYREVRLKRIGERQNTFFNFVTAPTARIRHIFEELSREEVSIIMRVMSNTLPLKDFYYKLKRASSPKC